MTVSDNLSAIEKALEGAKKEADRHYCNALDQFQKTLCLGADYKMKNGEFGKAEHEAHKVANEAMGRHFGMYRAIKLVEPEISTLLAEARKAEALEQENAELRKTVADCSDALSAFADSVFNDNGDMTVNLGWATGDDYVRAYFADRRARTLLNGGSDAQG
jgi:hypothetical protein